MLSKCANLACLARFNYLHEGRIFKIEMGAVGSDSDSSPTRRIEHFWLCGRCAQTLKVVLENGVVTTHPLHRALPEGVAQKKYKSERDVA
jgi:hypothetical protein